jgi:transglutaminase/protease-like cytokinesis protein 3
MDLTSYYKVASYFYVYYGQKLAVDETFDLIKYRDFSTGIQKTKLRMRYPDIRKFEAEMKAVKLKADEILSSFNAGTEEEILFQISEYLRNNIVYTDNHFDLQNAILGGKAVCNGYALAFNLLANRAGIKSDMCIGKVDSGAYHAWNRVTLSDGSQYFYDVTFLDTRKPNYKYIHSSTPLHTDDYLINDYTNCWFGV